MKASRRSCLLVLVLALFLAHCDDQNDDQKTETETAGATVDCDPARFCDSNIACEELKTCNGVPKILSSPPSDLVCDLASNRCVIVPLPGASPPPEECEESEEDLPVYCRDRESRGECERDSQCVFFDDEAHVFVQQGSCLEGCCYNDFSGPNDDLDRDDDGTSDLRGRDNCVDEAGLGVKAYNPDQADCDKDGVGDACDNCPTVYNPGFDFQPFQFALETDRDGDGLGDACDPDLDGDAVANEIDNCAAESLNFGLSTHNPDQLDADGDGVGDVCDNCPLIANSDQGDQDAVRRFQPNGAYSDDSDGVGDACDNCPGVSNFDQLDTDQDGVGDLCDDDIDNDGLSDADDNCPLIENGGQEDAEDDGVGDVCDNCVDVSNPDQAFSCTPGVGAACDPDLDGDGVCDEDGVSIRGVCSRGPDLCPLVIDPRGGGGRCQSGQVDQDADGCEDPPPPACGFPPSPPYPASCSSEPDCDLGGGTHPFDPYSSCVSGCCRLLCSSQTDCDTIAAILGGSPGDLLCNSGVCEPAN